MLPGDELRVFTGQRHVTLEGDGAAVLRQTREVRDQHMVGRGEDDQVFAAVVLVDADDIEQVHREGDQAGVVILLFDALRQGLSFLAAVGVDLQQTVAALLQLRFQGVMLLAAGLDQIVKAVGGFRRRKVVDQLVMDAVVNGPSGRAGMLEGVETFVVPAHQHRLRGLFQVRDVDLDIVRLADTVEAADTLLQQIRVKRQIEHHQIAGELEVASFGTDLRAQQHLGAGVFFGKPRRGAVAFYNRHSFMEHGGADTFALAQHLLQLQRGGGLGADHQHLLRTVAGQVAHQPLDARVEVPPGAGIAFKFLIDLLRIEHVARALFRGFAGAHDAGHFDGRLVLGRQRQANGVQLAFRETFDAVTGVTEQHAAGAVAVHQHRDQLLARGLGVFAIAVGGLQQRLDILLADQIAEGIEFVIAQLVARQQQGDGVGHRTVVLLFFDKLREIVEAVRIQQAQARKVALHPQLFRRRGQQQNARHALGQLFNSLIFAARGVFAPHQMVRFIDHHQVPLGVAQVLQTLLAAAHEV